MTPPGGNKPPISLADTIDPSLNSTQEAPTIGPAAGQTLGKYQILEIIGQGGMGAVYRGEDTKLRRQVAIKFLNEAQTANARSIERFFQEAQIAGNLQHPHLASIFDVGEGNGSYYMVMELLNPVNVSQFVKANGALSWVEATKIIADCCSALAAAHEVGLVHRDVKPDNILCSLRGLTKLVDFGLVKDLSKDGLSLSQSGALHGTPIYMSPEQCRSVAVDARSDLYSLGITYYHLLVGEPPFRGEGLLDLLMAHTTTPMPDPRQKVPTIPDACVEILNRATEKDPDKRYQTADEMHAQLSATLTAQVPTKYRFLTKSDPAAQVRQRDSLILTPQTQTPRHDERLPAQSSLSRATGDAMIQKPPSRRSFLYAAGGASLLGLVGVAGGLSLKRRSRALVSAQPPIRVGILSSMTGGMAICERAHTEAMLLAFDELNAQGGLLGHPVEAIQCDGRSEGSMFVREAERLIVKEKVVAVFSGAFSAARRAMKPLFEKHDHLLLYSGQHEGLEDSPAIIYTGAIPNQCALPAVRWFIQKLGKRRFFLVGTDSVFPHALNAVLSDELRVLGAKIVGEKYALQGESDFDPIIKELIASKPDVIINTVTGDSNMPFFRALHAAGVDTATIPTLSLAIDEGELPEVGGAALAGDYLAASYFQGIDRPANRTFLRSFKARYGEYRTVGEGMEAAYATVHLWAKAVQAAGNEQPKLVRQALKGLSLEAPSGELRINPSNNHAWKTFLLAKINAAGEVEIVVSSPQMEPPQPFPSSRTRSGWEGFVEKLNWDWDLQWQNPKQPRGLE